MATETFGAVIRHICTLAGRPNDQNADGELLHAFIGRGDQAAFEVILKRHGPMVLRVCRGVLGSLHDAEDAFQATFLFLAQRAASIRKRESLASWLHGVAYRMATNARRSAARRGKHERQSRPAPVSDPARDAAWHEVQSILDEEIQRLSKTQREPFVRCCLEYRSCAEVAAHMGLQEPAVRSRVARARKLLEQRLGRRGVSLTLVCAALAVSGNPATAQVAPTLLGATAAAAVRLTCAYGSAQGLVSAQVLGLLKGMNQAMALARIKTALALLLGTLFLAGGTALVYGRGLFAESGDQTGEPNAEAPRAEVKSPRRDRHTDWYGDPLPDEALVRLGTTRFRPGDHVEFVRFTPDGAKLVTHSASGVRVWDGASGRELRCFGSVAGKNVARADLSADGKLAVTADAASAGPLRLWDVSTGRELRQFGNFRLFGPVRLAPDGKTIAAEGPSGVLELWDVAKAERRHTLKALKVNGWSSSVMFTADGKTLVTGGADKTIRLWDVATGRELQRIDCPETISSVVLSLDQKLLASVGQHNTKGQVRGMTISLPDNRVRVWDAVTGKELRQLVVAVKRPSREGISAVAFGPDSKTVVTIGIDHVLRVWDATTGKELRSFSGCSTNSFALALHPDGKAAAFANGGTAVRIVDLETGKDRVPLVGHGGGIYAALITPDGRTAVTAGVDGTVCMWEARTGKEIRRLGGHDSGVLPAFALSPGGELLYYRDSDGKLRAWDTFTGRMLHDLKGDYNAFSIGMMAMSGDGKLAAGFVKKSLVLIDATSGKPTQRVTEVEARGCCGAGFSADGRTLVVWTDSQEVYVIDGATGKTRKHYPFAGDKQKEISYRATLSPDGRLIAFGSQHRFLSILDVNTGAEVCRFEGLPDGVSAVAFSPDGRTLAWGGWNDPTIHLLELSTRGERHRLLGHQGRILALHFSRDARVLVSGGNDATALIWDLAGRREQAATREKDLSAEEFESLWKELGTADAPRGYQAVRRLGRSPAAVGFLGTKIHPLTAPEDKHAAKLIADLKSNDFRTRDKATKELERLGDQVAGACRKALVNEPSLEARRRLQKLLDQQASEARRPSAERVRLLRALEALELAGSDRARQLLSALAEGAPGAWLTQQAQAGRGRLDRRR